MKRDVAIDVTRGIAIILVAAFHMTGGLVNANKLVNSPALEFAGRLAYTFHVQIFFLLSGYFLFERMESWRAFAPRAINLYYPYLLWSFIAGGLAFAMSGAVNSEVSLKDLMLIPVVPIQQYWFLLDLIFAMALFIALRRMIELAFGVLLALAIVETLSGIDWPGPAFYAPGKLAYWAAFLFLGAIVRKHGWGPHPHVAGFALALAFAAASVLVSMASEIPIREGVFFASSVAACYALYCVSVWTANSAAGKILARVGALSLAVYLTHVIFGAGIRVVTYRLWDEAPVWLVAVVGTSISVFLPLLLHAAARYLAIGRLLGFEPLMRENGR